LPFFRARGFHAANIQADADLHAISSHHRDAVHEMRYADAARINRAAKPQARSADLPLRALRLRRELFERDLDRRDAASKFGQPIKALIFDAVYGGYSLAICVDAEWKIPAPETCDAIRNAATMAGTLISLKN
jgi:hypothetical protein